MKYTSCALDRVGAETEDAARASWDCGVAAVQDRTLAGRKCIPIAALQREHLLELFTDDVGNAASIGRHLAVPVPAA